MFKRNKNGRMQVVMAVAIEDLIMFLILQINMWGVVKINLVKIIVKHLRHSIMVRMLKKINLIKFIPGIIKISKLKIILICKKKLKQLKNELILQLLLPMEEELEFLIKIKLMFIWWETQWALVDMDFINTKKKQTS